MEKNEGNGSNSFSLSGGVFDLSEGEKMSPLGFMELLGVEDFGSSIFDLPEISLPSFLSKEMITSEVLNQPATPNSSSISSASSEVLTNNDEHCKGEDEDDKQQPKTMKQLKTKKTNGKKQREPRVAFLTKSEVDHLEDGYRWRKYGQKAVKNSTFPRSYYRCTIASCNVKKRVERSFNDPSIVVTTYEGQHTHPSPDMARPNLVPAAPPYSTVAAATNFAMPLAGTLSHFQQQSFANTLSPLSFGHSINGSANNGLLHERRVYNAGSAALADYGLLKDIIPSHVYAEAGVLEPR